MNPNGHGATGISQKDDNHPLLISFNKRSLALARKVIREEFAKSKKWRLQHTDNVWEGPDGNMGHVTAAFPMPFMRKDDYIQEQTNQSQQDKSNQNQQKSKIVHGKKCDSSSIQPILISDSEDNDNLLEDSDCQIIEGEDT